MSRALSATLAAAVVSTVFTAYVRADFNGEVLIAPPPLNWFGGTEEPFENGIRRVWRRPVASDADPFETVTVTRLTGEVGRTAATQATEAANGALEACDATLISDPLPVPADIGVAASVTATCPIGGRVGMFVLGQAYVGDFNTYTVVRTWRGAPDTPDSPANSPRAAEAWQRYFAKVSVCNTLTSACDSDAGHRVHAHPRYNSLSDMHFTNTPFPPRLP